MLDVAPSSAAARAASVKGLDSKLDEEILKFARRHGGPGWLRTAIDAFVADSAGELSNEDMQLAIPWSLYHHVEARDELPMAQRLRDERGDRLSPQLRSLLDAQLDAWLSIWEVQDVSPDVGMTLKDLLTGEERSVHEVRGTRGVIPRTALLGRVVTVDDVSFIAGMYPRPLPPTDADEVVSDVRRVCRARTKPKWKRMLREAAIQLLMLDLWLEAVEQLDHRPMPALQNTDGDPLVLTTDHFTFAPPRRGEVIARLSHVSGAGEPEDGQGETVITVTRPGNKRMKSWDNTIVGRLVIMKSRLKVESNSTTRADALRMLVEAQMGDTMRHSRREEVTAAQLASAARAAPSRREKHAEQAVPPELKVAAREMKEAHMLGWVDDQIPALGGLTPREAAKSPTSRRQLELLLKEFEYHEAQLPADERFDMRRLRVKLGLEG